MNKVLADTLDLIQHEARSRTGITIVSRMAPNQLMAQVDQDQLKQVFWNLATNAFDAMSAGGTLTIATGVRRVEVGGRRSDVIEIAFQDNGEGILKQNFDKIFLPFFTTKKKAPGWGWPRFIALWSCTRGGSRSRARSGTGHGSSCVSRSPQRRVSGSGMKEGNRGKDFSRR